MRLTLTVLLVAALAVAGIAQATVASSSALPKLVSTVGPGFTIKTTKAGVAVTSVKRGKYLFQARDLSPVHNLRLRGPGVNKATGIVAKTTANWTVVLKPGIYKLLCDPHPSMTRTLRVR